MKYFLSCSAFEIFVLQTAVPFVLMIIGTLWRSDILVLIAGIVWGVSLFSWLVSVSRTSNSRMKASLQRSTWKMEAGLSYAMIYLPIGGHFIVHGDPGAWIVVPHLAAMGAILYALWFSARQFSTLRHGKNSFENTFSCFVLMWFFPIGVWVLQPIVQTRLGENGA
jgi:hypothetical protein